MPADQHDSIHERFPVGTIVRVEKKFFDDDEGSIGVVYENYTLGEEHQGCSIITPTGEYDGFSHDCIATLNVRPIGFCTKLSAYHFRNVNQLSVDFNKGIFNECFNVQPIH